MHKSPLRSRYVAAGLAIAALSLLATGSHAQIVIADSALEFSGTQGQDDWSYGYYNLTLDGDGSYDAVTDFIAFDPLEFDAALNKWDLGANAPWTEVGVTGVHPNGTNNIDEHWAIRRWTAPGTDLTGPTLLQIDWTVAKVNANGTGVTGQLHLNSTLVDSAALAGNDTVGVAKSVFLTVDVGDIIDLACTPVGAGGDPGDGSDGSATSMIIATVVDTDVDGLPDSWEETWSPGNLTVLETGGDADSDGLLDEAEFAAGTNPLSADTDDDGYTDSEEIAAGTNPSNASSVPPGLADSRTDFSGVDGQDGWRWGYRNFTQDGNGTNYDAATDFIPFPVDGSTVGDVGNFWNGTAYDWYNGPDTTVNPPWTFLGQEGTHPNGTNNGDEHWTVRRWTASGLGGETPLRITWHTRKTNLNNDGVTGSIHLNGTELDSVTIAGNDGTGVVRAYYAHLVDGDILDLVLTPEGINNRTDGSDGSANWMRIDDRLPATPQQPNGKYFVPNNAVDADGDGLADFWEEIYAPGDPNALTSGQDFDNDGSNDGAEQTAGTDPTNPDTDADGLSDGEEATAGSNPCVGDTDGDGLSDFEEVNGNPSTDPTKADTDGDGFSDPEELAEGSNPNDANETPLTGALADSLTQFSGIDGQDGWRWGYRNVSLDGKGTDYDAATDFIPFPVDGTIILSDVNFWNGTAYDWADATGAINPPWTQLGAENTHPNGTNNGEEHWTVRRWTTSGLGAVTAVRITWHTRGNGVGDGTTGAIHVNGIQVDSAVVPGADTVGVQRLYYVNLNDGDIVDQVLTPVGVSNTGDGSDTSFNWMRIDTRIPEVPIQPNGKYFIPVGSEDTDGDGLADFVEIDLVGNLDDIDGNGDTDGDGLTDADELLVYCTDRSATDSDGDGLTDGDEINTHGTDPAQADTDGDCFSDFHEVATGYSPLDEFDNINEQFLNQAADSRFDFPLGEPSPQGAFNGWTYGYYNTTQDGEPPVNTNFIEFLTDGSTFPSSTNSWNGDRFDFFDDLGATVNPPWSEITADGGHPNGDNNVDVHWATRRWTAGGFNFTAPGPLLVHYHLHKNNPNGNGTTAVLIHNGQQLDSITVAGNDTVGLKSWYYIDAELGDRVELALTPRGIDGLDGDGADASTYWMIVDTFITADPLQPDGSPFVPGGSGGGLRLLDANYDQGADSIALSWENESDVDYQIGFSPTGDAPWTLIGPTLAADPSGTNTETIDNLSGLGVTGETQLFRVFPVLP